jgi:hypothetical protein
MKMVTTSIFVQEIVLNVIHPSLVWHKHQLLPKVTIKKNDF